MDYIENKSIRVEKITRTSINKAKYKSFKLIILRTDLKKMLNHKFWPLGIKVKIWREPKGRHQFIKSKNFKNKNIRRF